MSRTAELPIVLSDLAPATREWLLSKAAAIGVPPQSILVRALDDAALRERSGQMPPVPPMPTHNPKAA